MRIWKNKYLDETSATALAEAFGKVGHLMKAKIIRLAWVDFLALQILPLGWDIQEDNNAQEKIIQRQKTTLQDACLLHYDMNLEAVQRFSGS